MITFYSSLIISTAEKYSELLKSKVDMGEQLLKKAQQEQEKQYQEKQRMRKERENQMRKELQDYQLEVLATKAKQAQEERDMKMWETMQRFKRSECDEKYRDEERKKNRDKKIEYGNEIKRYIVSLRKHFTLLILIFLI